MLRKVAFGIAAAAIVCYLLSGVVLGALGSYLVKASPPEKADIAVVLAGDGTGNRILKAAELVRAGYVPRVLVSGPDGVYGLYECDLAIPFAVKAGYPESYFEHLENHARSTREEAAAAAAVLRRMGVHKVLVVTSDYHTRRSGRMYASEAPDLEVVMVAAPDANFKADGWWHSREGRKTAFYEWLKTVTSWFGV
jgi:uncharacterized SAM-binding protein YcdF (DUF218 family)